MKESVDPEQARLRSYVKTFFEKLMPPFWQKRKQQVSEFVHRSDCAEKQVFFDIEESKYGIEIIEVIIFQRTMIMVWRIHVIISTALNEENMIIFAQWSAEAESFTTFCWNGAVIFKTSTQIPVMSQNLRKIIPRLMRLVCTTLEHTTSNSKA